MNEQTALAVVQKHEQAKDLVFVRPEDLQTQAMFVPEVTVLHATPEDFHRISGGQMMPKSYHTDRIGQAAGISFIAEGCGTRKEGENVYVGYAQGRKRLPDGTWRISGVHEYEFDVDSRAREDFLANPDKYPTDVAKERHVLELKRFARQRAGTGARLKVIRELAGIPIAFRPEQINRAMVVCRIAVNTSELLATPGMQQAAIQQAVGTQPMLFGPEPRDVTPDRPALEAPAATADPLPDGKPEEPPEDDFQDDIPWDESPETVARRGLENFLALERLHPEARQLIEAMLADKNATLEAMNNLAERTNAWLEKAGVPRPDGGAA